MVISRVFAVRSARTGVVATGVVSHTLYIHTLIRGHTRVLTISNCERRMEQFVASPTTAAARIEHTKYIHMII